MTDIFNIWSECTKQMTPNMYKYSNRFQYVKFNILHTDYKLGI